MPGLVPGIHVLTWRELKDVDGRDEPGHDGVEFGIADERKCSPDERSDIRGLPH
jgi:hypothetical protein